MAVSIYVNGTLRWAPGGDARVRVGAVVLAAGGSSRLGFPKQLLRYRGEPLVRRAAAAAVAAGADPVVAVLGAAAERVGAALADLPGVRTLVHTGWRSGIGSSLAAGVSSVMRADAGGGCDGVLVTLADQPQVGADALRRLLDTFSAERRLVAAAYGPTVGAPAVFGREHVAELMRLEGDAGAGRWLRGRAEAVTAVPIADALFDVDTPEDLARLVALDAGRALCPDAATRAHDGR